MAETAADGQPVIKRKKIKVNKRKMIRALLILVVAAYLMHTAFVHYMANRYDKLIYPGIKVEGIKLGGKTKEEAINILKNKYEKDILKKNIVIKVGEKEYSLNYSKLNIKYNIDDTIKGAFDYGKDRDTYEKYKTIKQAKDQQLSLKYSYDKKELEKIINEIENDFNKRAVDASISKSGGFNLTSEKEGQKVDRDKLLKEINNYIANKSIKDIKVAATINKVEPRIKKSQLDQIDTKISSSSTSFVGSSSSRSNNIMVSSKALDGKVIMPDETFSFNDIVGERTSDRGYQSATVIVGNKFESGLGGGVCQVSSTLHNAVVRAGITPMERQHHTMKVGYVGLGMDATVDYGSIDYKFKNPFPYPIYIESVVDNQNLSFNIYSNSELTNKKYNLVNSVDEVKRNGKTCTRARGYKVTCENGKEISRQEINTDYYEINYGIN